VAELLVFEPYPGFAHDVIAQGIRRMSRVAISILNYNRAKSTVACVQSLLNAHQAVGGEYQLEIFMGDEPQQLTQELAIIPNVHLTKNIENFGFSAGHNRNLREIFSRCDPDFVWLLNNDCLVEDRTLPALLKCARDNPHVAIWGATLLETDGETIQCAGGCQYNSWISSYQQHGEGKPRALLDELPSKAFDYIAGASMFFPVATLQNGFEPPTRLTDEAPPDEKTWLNEIFFLYFEELDLAKRLKPEFELGWCRDALIRHAGGLSTRIRKRQRTPKTEYHSTLSALKFTRLYYPRRLWFMVPSRLFLKGTLFVFNGSAHLLKPLMLAYRDFWRWLNGSA
jgi:GT2 family glycosyltransferase